MKCKAFFALKIKKKQQKKKNKKNKKKKKQQKNKSIVFSMNSGKREI